MKYRGKIRAVDWRKEGFDVYYTLHLGLKWSRAQIFNQGARVAQW